jgi:hypothetical protein
MTAGAAGQRWTPPPVVRSVLTPSLSTSPATGASAGSPSRGSRNRLRAGELEPTAPPTASEGRPNKAGLFATRGRTQGRTTRWSSRAGRAAGRELEPTFLSCAAIRGCRDDDTSVARGGNDEEDPDMSLQSTAALATSPLHDGSGDGSSLEEMLRSPAFCLLIRLSLR